jgi:hypothetical protein
MIEPLAEALSRTLLLMRDDLNDGVSDSQLLEALTSTEVVVTADEQNLSSHAAQCAFVTAAMLMARSGHRVYLSAPDLPMLGSQPPLNAGRLISALTSIGADLLPGIGFRESAPAQPADLAVALGSTPVRCPARRMVSLHASPWSGILQARSVASLWREADWPYGALAAGALASGEAFKIALAKLARFARHAEFFADFTRLCEEVCVRVAPEETPQTTHLAQVDFVSAGAITNAVLFCLGRILDVRGQARLIEDTTSDHSNLNRYALLRRSEVGRSKAQTLAEIGLGELKLTPVTVRYSEHTVRKLQPLAPQVVVGVDHIPTRWLVQRAWPTWLGVGATTHWNAMSSAHGEGLACAGCLHPRDDGDNNLIPTVAFVSFWAGLLLSVRLLRAAAGERPAVEDQHEFWTPLRPERIWRGPVERRVQCPVCRG